MNRNSQFREGNIIQRIASTEAGLVIDHVLVYHLYVSKETGVNMIAYKTEAGELLEQPEKTDKVQFVNERSREAREAVMPKWDYAFKWER